MAKEEWLIKYSSPLSAQTAAAETCGTEEQHYKGTNSHGGLNTRFSSCVAKQRISLCEPFCGKAPSTYACTPINMLGK